MSRLLRAVLDFEPVKACIVFSVCHYTTGYSQMRIYRRKLSKILDVNLNGFWKRGRTYAEKGIRLLVLHLIVEPHDQILLVVAEAFAVEGEAALVSSVGLDADAHADRLPRVQVKGGNVY